MKQFDQRIILIDMSYGKLKRGSFYFWDFMPSILHLSSLINLTTQTLTQE